MPERWETELRKLRTLGAPEDLAGRVAEGPHGEPSTPPGRRMAAVVTAFAVFAAAALLAVRALGPGGRGGVADEAPPEGVLVLKLLANEGSPTATLTFDDQQQHGINQNVTWCIGNECSTGHGDFAFYPPVTDLLVVPPATPIAVTGDGVVDDVRVSTLEDETVPGASAEAVPGSDGSYSIEVRASWPEGEANFFFGVQVLSSLEGAPDTLHVDCAYGAPRLDSAVVRTQADGMHLDFTGTDGFRGFEIVTPEGTPPEDLGGVGGNFSEDRPLTTPIPPGRWEIGCAGKDGRPVTPGEEATSFELVDPDDHYAPTELACAEPAEQPFTSSIPVDVERHEGAAAQVVTGLGPEDRLRGAGYDAAAWKVGFTYVVDRGGEAVARLVLSAAGEVWEGTLTTCEGSGIALSEAATSPAPPPDNGIAEVPDVLVMRCEGLGPSVDSDTVRLQPDGLHVEATNVAEANVLVLDPNDGTIEGLAYPFVDSPTQNIVVSVPEGPLWVGCLVTDQQGEIVGGPDEVPDAYVEITVLPAKA